ncbi:FimV/HubP family polar landmark protein [Massilia cavernae]|uniref:Pilus assembly protein FimV n=1 Tax=Massilia cavernae TaxID=2320864 RepID=A0A418XXX4_9BURK|nr:FimV/HubP family polar landmark protein [Massilia cavernae]RJG17798.1 pilus assembly protein FimV [Massilia cavernae]
MHVNKRPKIVSFAMKALAGAVASAVLMSSAAYAAGLGKLTVMSSLGQPLRAEIELTSVSSEEASGLVAKLASPEAFRLANIDFNPALLSLRFTIENRGGRQFIKISSSQPLNEPFVDMLLELNWESGRLVREYTFLLDPAELRATQPAQVAAPGSAQAPATPAPSASDYRPAQRPATPVQQAPAPRAPERAAASATEYRVKQGDTLGKVAAELKPVDISLDMMLVALYRANPDAFAGNNMNRLKSGRILAVPDTDAIRGTGQGEARGVVVAHAADFNAYRAKLAGQVATAAPTRTEEAGQSAAGKITARVEERPTAVTESKDKLQLSRAAPAAQAEGRTSAATEEDRIAKDKALAEATARVKELERNVGDLEKLMTVKSQAGADAAKATAPEAAPPVAAAAEAAAKPAPAIPPRIKPAAKPAQAAPSEPSFFEMLMDNISLVLAGLGVLLLALVGISTARRRKAAAADTSPSEPSILGAPTDQAHSMFAETGGQSVDTNNSVFNSSFAPSASQLDTNEVDPVAEADVYIAYGRDAQAEEILKEALRTHPERYPVRQKLLEIYAARKDQRAFEAQASEMYGMTKGQGDEWAQAAALGLMLDPGNPLYASASGGEAVMAEPSAQERGQQAILSQEFGGALDAQPADKSDMDFDLGLLDAVEEPTAAPIPAPETQREPEVPVASAPAAAEEHTLDFDLGGLAFEPVAQAEQAPASGSEEQPAPVPAAQETSAFDMDFDMDFGAAPAEAPAPAPTKSFDEISLDLGQDEQPQDFGTVDLSKASDALPDSLMDLDAMTFDLASTAAPSPVTGTADAAPQAHRAFEVPDLPFEPLDESTVAPMAAPQATQFDMSGIDLDLPPTGRDETALPDLGELDHLGDAGMDAGGEMSTVDMEMETKLDLAIAYQEIGDKEGARELLDEVIKGGNAGQVGKANGMRAKLG